MNLYRFRLIPESPWRTPWQSDTLAGLLCWMCARTEGDTVLRRQIIEPALAGRKDRGGAAVGSQYPFENQHSKAGE